MGELSWGESKPFDNTGCWYQERRRTCKCIPLCEVCGWGRHAAIHSMPLTFEGAHPYSPATVEAKP